MKKGINLKRKVSLFAFFMVGVLFLSSVFTMLIDTSKAAGGSIEPTKGYTLRDADIKDYDIDSKLNSDKVLSSKVFDNDDKVLVIVEVDGNSLGDNYNTYANTKYQSMSEYVASDIAQGYALNMKARQLSLYNRLSNKFDIEYKSSYTSFFNGFSAYVRYGDIKQIENDERVHNVVLSERYAVPETISSPYSTTSPADVATNVVKIHESTGIYDTRESRNTGIGTIVAILDTGLDHQHPAFQVSDEFNNIGGDGKYYEADIAEKFATKSFAAEEYTEGLTSRDVYISEKIPFAYDYADKDSEVFPTNYHGTHVAGIVAGHDEIITGAAPKAQLAIMKVFNDKDEGANEADIWAAVEDCVYLDVDVINMSLGVASGFTTDKDKNWSNVVYKRVLEAGINLVAAAGNDFSSGLGSTHGLNLASNPDSGTVGSPSTYAAAVSVGSISGVKTPYMLAYDSVDKNQKPVNGLSIYYTNPSDNNGEELDFMKRLLVDENGDDINSKEFEYVMVPGIGTSSDYNGIDVKGKIAVVKRGVDTFITKVEVAHAFKAIGVIIRNNVSGVIRMSLGTRDLLPACSIKADVGDELFNRAKAKSAAGQASGGKILLDRTYKAGPFMSDFSSWGPLPDLEMKPDIVAHGGDITSADIGGGYEVSSGTSMAAPNYAGITALLRQHVILNASEYGISSTDNKAIRSLVNQLFMSTATIAINENSDPYSPRKQGSGLADLKKAEDTRAYLYVENEDGSVYDKTKITLGDDKNRTGVYEFSFFLKNISSRSLVYNLNTVVMTEGLSIDEKTVTEVPVLLDDTSTTVSVSGAGSSYNKSKKAVTVDAGKYAKINVSIKLSKSEKKYLDESFKNGMYVEGFVTLTPTTSGPGAIDLSIPYLAFYGDWTDAPILDKTIYETSPDEVNKSMQEHEKNKPDVKSVTPYGRATREQGNSIYEYYFPLGTNLYLVADRFNEIPTEEDRNALSLDEEGVFMLWGVGGFLRNAKTVKVSIKNTHTGQTMVNKSYQNALKSSGMSVGLVNFDKELDIRTFISESGLGFVEGGKYTFEMEAFLDWGDGKTYGNNNKFSFSFYIDSVAPEILDVNVRQVKDRNFENPETYIDFEIFDAHYVAAMDLQYYNPQLNRYLTVFGEGMMPINNQRGKSVRATIDVTNYWDYIVANGYEMMIFTVDYAWNQSYQYINIKDASYNAIKSLSFNSQYDATSLKLKKFEEYDLRRVLSVTPTNDSSKSWDEDYDWYSSNENIVSVKDGKVLALDSTTASGPVTITVKSKTTTATASINIEVSESYINNDAKKIHPTKLDITDSSLILPTGTDYIISADIYPQKTTDEVMIEWTSNSAYDERMDVKKNDKGELDPNGKTDYQRRGIGYVDVVAIPGTNSAKVTVRGNFREALEGIYAPEITARMYTRANASEEWKRTSLSDSCTITVPQTYTVNYHILERYNGNEANVSIPGDLGIEIIGEGAFTGNPFIQNLTVPEGIRAIKASAFAYCEKLEEVYLPESLISIAEWAFAARNPKEGVGPNVTSLRKVQIAGTSSTRKLRSIGERAFSQCELLESIDLSTVASIGDLAFMQNIALTSVDLSNAKTLGEGAFYACSNLSEITFSEGVEIGDFAFFENVSLTELDIPAARIGTLAFNACLETDPRTGAFIKGLSDVRFTGNGPLTIGDLAFVNCMNLDTIDFGDTEVRKIGVAAFAAAKFVTEITLPRGLEYIGERAFELTDRLTRLNIPADTDFTSLLPDGIFANCPLLETINIDSANPFVATNNNIIYAKKDGNIDFGHIVYVAPNANVSNLSFDAIKVIDAYAFSDNSSIVSLDLSGVEEIGEGAFKNCTNLLTVGYSASLLKIGSAAFDGCTRLGTVSFIATATDGEVSGLTSIGEAAFRETRLSSIVLPEGITEIADYTFFNSTLTTLTAEGTITTIGDYAFTNSSIRTIDLSKVTSIGEGAFMLCTNLGMPSSGDYDLSSVETIGDYAFERCGNLVIKKLDAVKTIGDYAFAQCSGILDIKLPEVTSIGAFAFSANFHNPLYTPDSDPQNTVAPANIPHSFNQNSARLKSVDMPKVEYIYGSAFRYTALTTVEIPSTLIDIKPLVFSNCANLKEINVSDDNEFFFDDDGVFYGQMPRLYPLFAANGNMSGYSENSFVLIAYPMARVAETEEFVDNNGTPVQLKYYSAIQGTVKVEAGSFIGSKLEYIELPYELMVVGHQAFFACNDLVRMNFHSFEAPALETEIRSEKVTLWSQIPDFYNYATFSKATANYSNYVFAINGTNNNKKVEAYHPLNAVGYDSYLYGQFFADIIPTTEYVMSTATEKFINDINNLPENLDWKRDNELITKLVNIRSLLSSDQLRYVSDEVLQKLATAKLWIDNNVPTEKEPNPNNVVLIVLLICGCVLLVGGGVAAFFIIRKKKMAK